MAVEPYVSDARTSNGVVSEIRFEEPADDREPISRCWHVRVSRTGYVTHFSSHYTRVVALRRVETLRRSLEVSASAMIRLVLLLTLLATPALADSCASLPAGTQAERNAKYYCRAQAEGSPSYCASIFGDLNLKRLCEARTGRPSSCASIQDRSQRLYCQGVTGR